MEHCNQNPCWLSPLSAVLALQTPPSWADELTDAASSEERLPTARLMEKEIGTQGMGAKIAMTTNPIRTGLGKPGGTCLLTRFHHCPAHFAFFCGQMHKTPTNYASESGYKRHRFSTLHLQD